MREMGREREGVGLVRREGDREMTAVADNVGALLSTEDTPILHSPILHTGTATTSQYHSQQTLRSDSANMPIILNIRVKSVQKSYPLET